MLRFFSKIRFKLVAENKVAKPASRTGRYLRYAIGEILLVVIGILIALQVNNWNEDKKTKRIEVKTLKELRSDLIQNRDEIELHISSLETCKKANEIVLFHFKNNLPYHDSLDIYFGNLYPYITFTPIQTTYDNLRQTGINLISNDSLRTKISVLYSNNFNAFRVFESTYFVEHYTNYIKPMLMNEFITFEAFSLKPKDYNELIKSQKYKQIMNYTVSNCQVFIAFQTQLKDTVERLITEIDTEID